MKKSTGWMYLQNKIVFDKSIFDDDIDETDDDNTENNLTSKNKNTSTDDTDTSLLYCCHLCRYESRSRFHYTMHLAEHKDHFNKNLIDVHTDEQHPKCTVCGYFADGNDDFIQHISGHDTEDRFVCVCCYKDYTSIQDLKKHHLRRHIMTNGPIKYILDRKTFHRDLRNRRQKAVALDLQVMVKDIGTLEDHAYHEIEIMGTSSNVDCNNNARDNYIIEDAGNNYRTDKMEDAIMYRNPHSHPTIMDGVLSPASTSVNVIEQRDPFDATDDKVQHSAKHLSSSSAQLLNLGNRLGSCLRNTQYFRKMIAEKVKARRDRSPGNT